MHRPGTEIGATRCLILAHGAGSSAAFLSRAFPGETLGADTCYLDDRTGSTRQVAAALAAQARLMSPHYDEVYLGGVSMGAHAAAEVCAGDTASLIAGCVLALPAWLGIPEPGHPTSYASAEVAALGVAGVLARLRADAALRDDWVTHELLLAWQDRPTLPTELRTAAAEPAPVAQDLRRISVPALVLGLRDDPVHSVQVAQTWAALIPNAELEVLPRDGPAASRAVFGAAVGRWLAGLSGSR